MIFSLYGYIYRFVVAKEVSVPNFEQPVGECHRENARDKKTMIHAEIWTAGE